MARAVQYTITGDGTDTHGTWNAAGAVTLANSGFYDVSFGGIDPGTLVAFGSAGSVTAKPSWATCGGFYVQAASASSGPFINDWDTINTEAAAGRAFEVEFGGVMFYSTGATITDGATFNLFSDSTNSVQCRVTSRNGRKGIQVFINTGSTFTCKYIYSADTIAASPFPGDLFIPMDTWIPKLSIMYKAAASGEIRVKINNRTVLSCTKDLSAFTSVGFSWQVPTGNLPTGVGMRHFGPYKTDNNVTTSTEYAVVKSVHDVTKRFPVRFLGTAANGCVWASSTTGSASVVVGHTGNGNRRPRAYVSTTGATGDTGVLTLNESVYNGTTDPNPFGSHGYTTICINSIYLEASAGTASTYTAQVRNSGNSADLIKVNIDNLGAVTVTGTTLSSSITAAAQTWYDLWIQIRNSDGAVFLTLWDQTAITMTAAAVQSAATNAAISGWTAGTAIGILKLTLGCRTTGALGGGTICSGVGVYRTPGLLLGDSFQSGSDQSGGSITLITSANPAVVTSARHGLTSGATVTISGSNSGISIDGARVVTYVDQDRFSVPVNNSGAAGNAGSWTWVSSTAPNVELASPTKIGSYFDVNWEAYSIPGGYRPAVFGHEDSFDFSVATIQARRGGELSLYATNMIPAMGNTYAFKAKMDNWVYNDQVANTSFALLPGYVRTIAAHAASKSAIFWWCPAYEINSGAHANPSGYTVYDGTVMATLGRGFKVSYYLNAMSINTATDTDDSVHPNDATAELIARNEGSTLQDTSSGGGSGRVNLTARAREYLRRQRAAGVNP